MYCYYSNLFVCVRVHNIHVRIRQQLTGVGLSFHSVSPMDLIRTSGSMANGKHLYLQGHLASPSSLIKNWNS